jgi:hypothetical protein
MTAERDSLKQDLEEIERELDSTKQQLSAEKQEAFERLLASSEV